MRFMASHEAIQVEFSEDEYEAYLTIAASPDPQPMNATKLRFALKSQGVVYGVLEEALERAIEDHLAGRAVVHQLVAEGIRPREGVQPAVELKFELSTKPKEDAKGRIDYREISSIFSCHAGDVLALKKKMRSPVNGITVSGTPITLPHFEDVTLISGANVQRDETDEEVIFRAKIDGALKFENNMLSIQPVLDLANDVDFSVGNVHFDGDVRIGRDVLPDFSVEASGKVSILGSAIACQIRSRDAIEVHGGVIGKGRAELRSDKSITVTFVENARLFATGDILVRNGIMNSEAHCHECFSTEAKSSRITESTIIAGRGIRTQIAGSPYSVNTKLITGINTEKEKEYLKVKETLDGKIREAREIERRYGRAMLESRNLPRGIMDRAAKDLEKWDKLKEDILQVNSSLKGLEELMYDYSATIVVKEMLYPKVFLKIGKYETVSSREQHNVTVRYSADECRLVF
jgi:uncharacterized protein